MSDVDTSDDFMLVLAARLHHGLIGKVHGEAAIRALLAERDALRAQASDILAENDALRFTLNYADATLDTARREAAAEMREAAAHIVDSTPTTDQRAAHEVMRRIRALPLPGDDA